MKNRAFLSILEQILMILIFALAASLCLRGFFLANTVSKDREVLDLAVFSAQNTAETLKSTKGDLICSAEKLSGNATDNKLTVFYDSDGNAVKSEKDACYTLTAVKTADGGALVESAHISVVYKSEIIFEIDAVWQKGGNS